MDPMPYVQALAGLSVIATGTRAAWLVLKRLDSRHPLTAAPSRAEERLTELERTNEAIVLELERIGEAQRFTAKLLAERLPPALPPRPPRGAEPGRVATPH